MPNEPWQALTLVVLQDVVLSMLTVGLFWTGVSVARGVGRPVGYSLAPLGFSKPNRGYFAGTRLGLLVGLGALLANLLIAPLSIYILEELGYSTDSNIQGPFMQGLTDWVSESPGTAIPAIIAVVALFGPATEELVFRGAIFGGLYRLGLLFSRIYGTKANQEGEGASKKVSFALSALLSASAFALVHLEPRILLALFILALVLALLYTRTGSLLPCFVAHATFNSLAVSFIILRGLNVLPALV
ncbi:MAG: CPBP family glutamic-type intramembrane protease [Actinomycetota bacterium]|nr:CPBP family glutamic-type intramembrane protease [Actinomycetota bacterium]